MMAAADFFRLRTTMKRKHTNLVARIHGMINRRASRVEVEVLSATLADVLERPIEQSSRTPQSCERTTAFAPPSRWPKIVVEKFNGDPRKWQRFAHGIHATVRDANIPDSYKLLGLQDSIMDDIRKRMGHLFNGSYAFETAWNELESKYGNPGLIMQAHNQHLLQVQPFKAGDFNALFSLAADVRDAVSSVPDGHLKEFTYSTVITSLASKLPI